MITREGVILKIDNNYGKVQFVKNDNGQTKVKI